MSSSVDAADLPIYRLSVWRCRHVLEVTNDINTHVFWIYRLMESHQVSIWKSPMKWKHLKLILSHQRTWFYLQQYLKKRFSRWFLLRYRFKFLFNWKWNKNNVSVLYSKSMSVRFNNVFVSVIFSCKFVPEQKNLSLELFSITFFYPWNSLLRIV